MDWQFEATSSDWQRRDDDDDSDLGFNEAQVEFVCHAEGDNKKTEAETLDTLRW